MAERAHWNHPIRRLTAQTPLRVGSISVAPDGETILLSIHGKQRSVLVVRRPRILSDLLGVEALDRFRAGDLTGAANLLEESTRVDPTSGDAIYNLACVHTLLGNLPRAKAELRIALAIDPLRYARLARKDADLTLLREDPAILRAIGVKDASAEVGEKP